MSAKQALSKLLARVLKRAIVVLCLTVMTATITPLATMTIPAASAQGANACNFRVGGPLAEDICWINFGAIDFNRAASADGVEVTQAIDANYVTKFRLKVIHPTYAPGASSNPSRVKAKNTPSWHTAVFGKDGLYTSRTTIANSIGNNPDTRNAQTRPRFEITEMQVVGTGRNAGQQYHFGLAAFDSEDTTNSNQGFRLESDVEIKNSVVVTTQGSGSICPRAAGQSPRVYDCVGVNSPQVSAANRVKGTFGVFMTDPTRFTAELKGGGQQDLAIGFVRPRMTANLTVDRQGVNEIGDNTAFTLRTKTSNTDYSDVPTNSAGTASAEASFFIPKRTKGTEEPRFEVFPRNAADGKNKRYDTKIVCTKQEGQEATHLDMATRWENNDTVAFLPPYLHSDLFAKVHCNITVTSKWDVRTELNLEKALGNGDGATEDSVRNGLYTINWACTKADFEAQYPDNKAHLTGQVNLRPTQTHTVRNIPVGAECVISESAAVSDESFNHEKQWRADNGQVETADTKRVIIRKNANSVTAVNNYTRKRGAISVTKVLAGDVSAQFAGQPFEFRYRCTGDTEKSLQVTVPAGSTSATVTSPADIPVNEDCLIWEVFSLSDEQSRTMSVYTSVKVNGSPAQSAQRTVGPPSTRYQFRIPASVVGAGKSLPIEVTNTIQSTVGPLIIKKQTAGTAAAYLNQANQSFVVNYECIPPQGAAVTGTVTLQPEGQQQIDNLPIGTMCRVWEEQQPTDAALDSTTFIRAEVSHSGTTKSNEDSRNQGNWIRIERAGETVPVVVTNTYDYKLSKINVAKLISGNTGVTGNTSFTINYQCGPRVVMANGAAETIQLNGSIELRGGANGYLTHSDPRVNDVDGFLGVPFGNTCTFSEPADSVRGLPTNFTFTDTYADGAGQDLAQTGLRVDAPEHNVTVTNNVVSTRGGLNFTLRLDDPYGYASATYDVALVCTDPAEPGRQIRTDVVLSPRANQAQRQFTTDEAPLGWNCTFEYPKEDETRQHPVTGVATDLQVGDTWRDLNQPGDFSPATGITVSDVHPGGDHIERVISYDVYRGSFEIAKTVEFQPGAKVPSQEAKRNEDYNFNVVCTYPYQGEPKTHQTVARQGRRTEVTQIPVGSICTIAEVNLTPEAGVTVDVDSVAPPEPYAAPRPANHTIQGQAPQTFRIERGPGAIIGFINTFGRNTTTVTVSATNMTPGSDAANAVAGAGGNQVDVTLVCSDVHDGAETFNGVKTIDLNAGTQPGAVVFEDVPVGTECRVSTATAAVSFNHPVTVGEEERRGAARLTATSTWTVNNGQPSTIGVDQAGETSTNHSGFFVTVAQSDPAGSVPNYVVLSNDYRYDTSRVQMAKKLVIAEEDKPQLDDSTVTSFRFNYVCQGPDYHRSNAGTVQEGLFAEVALSDMQAAQDENGKKVFIFTAPVSEASVHTGTICKVTEVEPEDVPGLKLVRGPKEGLTQEVTAQGNATAEAGGDQWPVTKWALTNTYEQERYKVGALFQAIGDRIPDNPVYEFSYVCTLNGKEYPGNRGTFSSRAIGRQLTSRPQGFVEMTSEDGQVIAPAQAFSAPGAAICTVTERESSVPEDVHLQRTGVPTPKRTPYTMLMGRALDFDLELAVDGEQNTLDGRNKVTKMSRANTLSGTVALYPGTVEGGDQAAFKSRTFTFEMPHFLPEGADIFGYTMVAQHIYLQDRKDVTVRKEAALPAGVDEQTFRFQYRCGDGAQFVEAEVAAGETFQIPGVPVGSACELQEHDYVVAGLTPDIQWAAGSDRITDLAYHGGGHPNPKGEQNAVRFVVQPVASVDDGDDAGAWALTVRNTYPKVELKKTIAGALVGSNGSSILDTAVLEPGQPEMIITYRVTNPTALSIDTTALADPSLINPNYQLFDSGGTPLTIDEHGVISGGLCQQRLGQGESTECQVKVVFSNSADEPINYRGEATVTATNLGSTLTASDSFGAVRPPRLPFLLPDTGTKAMVWVLGIGLVVVLGGLIRYLRRSMRETE